VTEATVTRDPDEPYDPVLLKRALRSIDKKEARKAPRAPVYPGELDDLGGWLATIADRELPNARRSANCLTGWTTMLAAVGARASEGGASWLVDGTEFEGARLDLVRAIATFFLRTRSAVLADETSAVLADVLYVYDEEGEET
jgi:hypothetical protein